MYTVDMNFRYQIELEHRGNGHWYAICTEHPAGLDDFTWREFKSAGTRRRALRLARRATQERRNYRKVLSTEVLPG